HAREAFLSAASARLAAMIPEVTIEGIARLTVPWFAEHCAVEISDPSHKHALALASADDTRLELPAVPSQVGHVRAPWFDDVAAARRAAHADPWRLAMPDAVRPQSLIVAPLTSGTRTLGRILLCSSARGYVADDLALAEELGRRA